MRMLSLGGLFLLAVIANAVPTASNSKDGGQVADLPENWDQTKDDTQSLFLNKSDKNDLEPYPLALSEEGNSEGYDQSVEQRGYGEGLQSAGELDNLIMRPALYGEPPAIDSLSQYDSRRRKRGSGTKVGGAGAATKVATKSGSGKKNLKAPSEPSRRKRDSGLSAADVRALLSLWEAQERRKSEWNPNQWAERYYGRLNPVADENEDVDENGDIWYNEPVVVGPREREFHPHPSYFSEQNRLALARGYPDLVDPELAQRYEEARRKRQYLNNNKMKRFMVTRKRSDSALMHQNNYRPRDDLYTLAELLRSAPRVHEQDLPVYRRLIL